MRSFSPRREEPALAAALRSRPNWKKPASRWYKLPPRSRSPKWWVPTASSWARASCTSPAMLNCRPRRKKSCGENWCRKRWTRCNRMRSSNLARRLIRTIQFARCCDRDFHDRMPSARDYRRCIGGYGSKTLRCGSHAHSSCVATKPRQAAKARPIRPLTCFNTADIFVRRHRFEPLHHLR